MNIAEIQKGTEQKMQKSVDALKADLAKIRTGRAHTGLLDHIQVDYYGTMVPLAQVAQVGLGDARRKALLRHFGSAERFLAASQEELEGVPGIPARTARAIYAQLHKAGRA